MAQPREWEIIVRDQAELDNAPDHLPPPPKSPDWPVPGPAPAASEMEGVLLTEVGDQGAPSAVEPTQQSNARACQFGDSKKVGSPQVIWLITMWGTWVYPHQGVIHVIHDTHMVRCLQRWKSCPKRVKNTCQKSEQDQCVELPY